MVEKDLFSDFYKGKRVLVTGHTGFKGSWLSLWLSLLGASVIGYSLEPYSNKGVYSLTNIKEKIYDVIGDIRDQNKLKKVFHEYQPEIIFHLAAQPLVGESYLLPYYTYETNLMGTLNVLACIKEAKTPQTGIFITTDKCYDNKEQIWGYKETDALGGYDPYSSSKAACEIAINSWNKSFFNPNKIEEHQKKIASVRAGNVIGGGDWSKDRLIPDCIRALETGIPIEIRNPKAIRPWQFVLEVLYGYILLAKKLSENPKKYSGSWNFGPSLSSVVTVEDLANKLIGSYGCGSYIDISESQEFHESQLLLLDISKAKFLLGWEPKLTIDEAIQMTTFWYYNYNRRDVYDICKTQIIEYSKRLS